MKDFVQPHFIERDPRQLARPGQSWAQVFHRRISNAKAIHPEGASVDVHHLNDYKGMRLFLTKDEMAGYAVKPDGEFTSVFKHPMSGYSDVGTTAAAHSILLGGATHLSAFDTVLPKMYTRGGYRQTATIPWNEEYKPENWPTEHLGRPNVAVMGAGHMLDKDQLPKQRVTEDYDSAMRTASQVGRFSHFIKGQIAARGNKGSN